MRNISILLVLEYLAIPNLQWNAMIVLALVRALACIHKILFLGAGRRSAIDIGDLPAVCRRENVGTGVEQRVDGGANCKFPEKYQGQAPRAKESVSALQQLSDELDCTL
jgi:hypothetical protein